MLDRDLARDEMAYTKAQYAFRRGEKSWHKKKGLARLVPLFGTLDIDKYNRQLHNQKISLLFSSLALGCEPSTFPLRLLLRLLFLRSDLEAPSCSAYGPSFWPSIRPWMMRNLDMCEMRLPWMPNPDIKKSREDMMRSCTSQLCESFDKHRSCTSA